MIQAQVWIVHQGWWLQRWERKGDLGLGSLKLTGFCLVGIDAVGVLMDIEFAASQVVVAAAKWHDEPTITVLELDMSADEVEVRAAKDGAFCGSSIGEFLPVLEPGAAGAIVLTGAVEIDYFRKVHWMFLFRFSGLFGFRPFLE